MISFQYLISVANLQAMLDSRNLVILDASIPPVGNMALPKHSWPDFRIPHARRFDLNKDFSDLDSHLPHTMVSAVHFEKAAQALGINHNSQIVVYDDLGLFSAARAWYMFRAMGHNNVAVLDGGLPHWLALNDAVVEQPLATNNGRAEQSPQIGNFIAKQQSDYFCDWHEVEQHTCSQQQLILDARANRRFSGEEPEPRAGVRSGHMPNAKNLPYHDLLTKGLMKPVDELTKIFSNVNGKNQAMIMSCGSGVTACILALAAERCGHSQVRVYDGSWSEWGSLPHTQVESC
ncbi:MAG: sulfurtransferase [Cognaticolwellia sp.]